MTSKQERKKREFAKALEVWLQGAAAQTGKALDEVASAVEQGMDTPPPKAVEKMQDALGLKT